MMPNAADVQDYLDTGHFTTARARSPRPRANQSSKLDPHVPRTFPGLPRRFPPPPSVEDEDEALAKELGGSPSPISRDEEPKFRGDVEQNPIILPVPEHNHERRFVLVPKTPGPDEDGHATGRYLGDGLARNGKIQYEANTGRKFALPRDHDGSPPQEPELKRRRSRLDLPRIDTDFESGHRPGSLHRSKSATCVKPERNGYFGPQEHQKPPGDDFLSPSVIKHATKGRDRAYFDFNQGHHDADGRLRSNDPRPPYHSRNASDRSDRPYLSAHPASHYKRASSAMEMPKSPRRVGDRHGSFEEPSSPRLRRKHHSPPLDERQRPSTPRTERRDSSPRDRHRIGSRHSSYKKRHDSPSRRDDGYSSDERTRSGHRHRRDRRKSIITQEDRSALLSPDSAGPMFGGRPKSRNATPVPSPRTSQGRFPDPDPVLNPRSSTSYFPPVQERRRGGERPASPFSSGSCSPRNSSRIREEEKSMVPLPNTVAVTPPSPSTSPASAGLPLIMALPALLSSSPTDDRRRSPTPVVPPPTSRHSSQDSNPAEGSWPPHFEPPPSGSLLGKPIVSFRRFSEDVSQGITPDLPECPRQTPTAGHVDWRTLAGCDNFNVCPSCYTALFANTALRSQLVPAPFRPADRKIACDMGSSHWYRIAWLMTKKYHIRDLRLLRGVAESALTNHPCTGDRRANRVWFTVRDPYHHHRRPLPNFGVCPMCTNVVEVLFPNLVSILQPADARGDIARGICAMHFAPERKRFLDYFDVLESTSDKAMRSKSSPDIDLLVDDLHRISRNEECARGTLVENKNWFVMHSVNDFTVCEECFDEAVFPELEMNSAVARDFYKKPQRLGRGSCQLYSARMRDVFLRACQRNDMAYLDEKVRERLDKEAEILYKLERAAGREDMERLLEEWKKWE